MCKFSFFLAAITFSIMALPSVSYAGQGWYVTMINNNNQDAYYQGFGNEDCWYPKDFNSNFTIKKNSSIRVYTEEKWAVFSGCGGGGQTISLNFLAFGENYTAAVFKVTLVDIFEHSPPGSNPVGCRFNGFGQGTAVGWEWVTPKPPTMSDPVLSCAKTDPGEAATYLTITLPTFH